MATFQVKLKSGDNVDIPDNVKVEIQGMQIIGDNVPDWNEPIQQNFVKIGGMLLDQADAIGTKADAASVYTKSQTDQAIAEALGSQPPVDVDSAIITKLDSYVLTGLVI